MHGCQTLHIASEAAVSKRYTHNCRCRGSNPMHDWHAELNRLSPSTSNMLLLV